MVGSWYGTKISDNEPWVIQGGLMTKSYQPKPILDRLGNLIKSWTSSGSLRTDSAGRAAITGFAGDYEVTVEKDGQKHYTTEIKADRITLLGGGGGGGGRSASMDRGVSQMSGGDEPPMEPITDDDIPF